MRLFETESRTCADDCALIVVSCTAFTALYLFVRRHVFPSMPAGFCNRMVSLVHAILMLPISAAAVDFKERWRDFGSATTASQAICLSITYGYFLYDTVGVYLIEHDWTNSVHHIASLLAFTVGIFQRVSGSELAWSLFLMEVSNPLLHLRAYFKETGRGESTAAGITNALFALSFLVCRVLIGPALAYTVLACPTSSIIIKCGGAGVQLISFLWAFKIAQIAFSKRRSVPPQNIASPEKLE